MPLPYPVHRMLPDNVGMRSIWLFRFAADTTAGCRQAVCNTDQTDYVQTAVKTAGMSTHECLYQPACSLYLNHICRSS